MVYMGPSKEQQERNIKIGMRIKAEREKQGKTLEQIAATANVHKSTIQRYESGKIDRLKIPVLESIAKALNINPLLITTKTIEDFIPSERWAKNASDFSIESLITFRVVGNIAAGYNGLAEEAYTDDAIDIPISMLRGRRPQDYFVLRVAGHSMHPQFVDGDKVLVQRCSSVDSGSVAVVMHNGEEATIKKVKYAPSEDWLELIPTNPDYMKKRIEGSELEECRVLGKVVMLLRDIV